MKWLLQLLIYMGLQQMNLRRILLDSTYKYKRTITWNGTLTTRFLGEDYWSKRISKTGTFYSGNVIE